ILLTSVLDSYVTRLSVWNQYGLKSWSDIKTPCSKVQYHVNLSVYCLDLKLTPKNVTAYKREYLNLGCDVDFDFAGPTIHGAAVVGYEGWLAGYQMSFDTAKSRMTKNNFAIGYKTGDFQLHTNVYVDLLFFS
ncbi:hypothetical protein GOODEAATRI_031573, partial [Goodea atripinnis]